MKTRRRSSARCFRFSALSVVLSGYFLISHRPAPRAAAVRNPVPEELKPYTETIPGTQVKFEMIPIPGGTFTMGTPPGELKRSDDEGPQHLVTVRPFWMEKTEAAWDEYDVFAFSQDLLKKKQQNADASQQPEKRTPPLPLLNEVGSTAADAVTRPTPPYEDETFGFGREGHPVIDITHHAGQGRQVIRRPSLNRRPVLHQPFHQNWNPRPNVLAQKLSRRKRAVRY